VETEKEHPGEPPLLADAGAVHLLGCVPIGRQCMDGMSMGGRGGGGLRPVGGSYAPCEPTRVFLTGGWTLEQ